MINQSIQSEQIKGRLNLFNMNRYKSNQSIQYGQMQRGFICSIWTDYLFNMDRPSVQYGQTYNDKQVSNK